MSVSKKRVRFSDTPQIREFESDAPDAKRAALDPMEQLEGTVESLTGECFAAFQTLWCL